MEPRVSDVTDPARKFDFRMHANYEVYFKCPELNSLVSVHRWLSATPFVSEVKNAGTPWWIRHEFPPRGFAFAPLQEMGMCDAFSRAPHGTVRFRCVMWLLVKGTKARPCLGVVWKSYSKGRRTFWLLVFISEVISGCHIARIGTGVVSHEYSICSRIFSSSVFRLVYTTAGFGFCTRLGLTNSAIHVCTTKLSYPICS